MVRLKETWTLLTFFRINKCYYKRSFYSHTQWSFYHFILFYFTAGKFCVWSWRIPGLLDRNVGFVVCRNSRASVAHMLYSGKEIQAKNNKWWKSWGVYRIVENTDPYSVHPSACLIFGPKKKSQHFATLPHWFPYVMTSEEGAQKFHTDDVSLPRSV